MKKRLSISKLLQENFVVLIVIAISGLAIAVPAAITGFAPKEVYTRHYGQNLPNIEDVPLTPWSEYIAADPEQEIGDILEGFDQRYVDMCQGATNRALKACAEKGFDGWVVQRMISGYNHVSGDITSHQDNIWGPRKCPQPQIVYDYGAREQITHWVIGETLGSMLSQQDLQAGTLSSTQVGCSIHCHGWMCPKEQDPFIDPWEAGYCDPETGKVTPESDLVKIPQLIDELTHVQQIGCRQRGPGCDIQGRCDVEYRHEPDCQLRVACRCSCPFVERPGQNIDDFIRDAPKDPYRDNVPQEQELPPMIPDAGPKPPPDAPPKLKDACMSQPCRVFCDDRNGDGQIDLSVAERAYKDAGLDPRQAGGIGRLRGDRFMSPNSATGPKCGPKETGTLRPPREETPPPTIPDTGPRPPETGQQPPPDVVLPPQKSCEEMCAEKGLSKQACDARPDYMPLVEGERCVSGAHFKKKQSILKECGCCSEPQVSVEVDRTPPICQTPCGPVQCDSSASCSCGENCVLTASCKWGGWKQTSSGVVPVLGVGQEQS